MAGKAGFLSFANQVLQHDGRTPAPHHRLLIDKLQDVADGTCDRLMVQMPPGSAKSFYGSILFPAYFFGKYPRGQIIATAHTASLADYFGGQVRKTIVRHGELLGVRLAKESRAVGAFSLQEGGEYLAAGVRGPITGRRADLILIDDPIKSWAEAERDTLRNALHDWYSAELAARLKPGGRIVLIMTRWHDDDLAGRLIRAGDGWTQLKLPALAAADDPLGRAEGAALWPAWQDEEAIARRRREVGELVFAAIYQQAPRPADSALFNIKTIRTLPEAPVGVRCIRAWDLAATAAGMGRDPDYTVGLKLAETAEKQLVVLDVIRVQASPAQVEERILTTAAADGTHVTVALPQDPGQAGAAQIMTMTRALAGYKLMATPETGSKEARAMPAATQIDAGNLHIVFAPWNDAFLAELAAFPDARKDDQVDALSRAVNMLAMTAGTAARRMHVPMMNR
jgi:predicted phage terminase large subunit-like protein